MNEILDIEVILKRNKYSKIYNVWIIMVVIVLSFLLIGSIYDYQTYLIVDSRVVNNELELLLRSDDVKYVVNNDNLSVDEKKYSYKIMKIDDELIRGIDRKMYQYVYLDVNGIKKINNYIYEVKFLKEKKKLIKYLKEYI